VTGNRRVEVERQHAVRSGDRPTEAGRPHGDRGPLMG
jgi:hypothetical protein